MPALAMAASSGPVAASAAATASFTLALSVTSTRLNSALPPSASIAATVACPSSSSTSVT